MTGPPETLINLANGYGTAPSAAGWMTRAYGERTWGLGASCPRCWKPLPPAEISKRQRKRRRAAHCQCGDPQEPEALTTLEEVLSAHGLEELAGRMTFDPVNGCAVRVG